MNSIAIAIPNGRTDISIADDFNVPPGTVRIDVHPDEEKAVIEVINETNRELPNLIATRWGIDFNVPLLLESKIGNNWLDVKDVA